MALFTLPTSSCPAVIVLVPVVAHLPERSSSLQGTKGMRSLQSGHALVFEVRIVQPSVLEHVFIEILQHQELFSQPHLINEV